MAASQPGSTLLVGTNLFFVLMLKRLCKAGLPAVISGLLGVKSFLVSGALALRKNPPLAARIGADHHQNIPI